MDRRTFVIAAAATPLAASGAMAETGAFVDPIIASHRNYLAAMDAFETTPAYMADTDEEQALHDLSWEYSKQVYSSVPTTIEGLITQLEHYRIQFLPESNWAGDMDFQLIDNAIKGIKRLAI